MIEPIKIQALSEFLQLREKLEGGGLGNISQGPINAQEVWEYSKIWEWGREGIMLSCLHRKDALQQKRQHLYKDLKQASFTLMLNVFIRDYIVVVLVINVKSEFLLYSGGVNSCRGCLRPWPQIFCCFSQENNPVKLKFHIH